MHRSRPSWRWSYEVKWWYPWPWSYSFTGELGASSSYICSDLSPCILSRSSESASRAYFSEFCVSFCSSLQQANSLVKKLFSSVKLLFILNSLNITYLAELALYYSMLKVELLIENHSLIFDNKWGTTLSIALFSYYGCDVRVGRS